MAKRGALLHFVRLVANPSGWKDTSTPRTMGMPGEQAGAAASSASPLCRRRLASCFSSGLTRASACSVDTSLGFDLLKSNYIASVPSCTEVSFFLTSLRSVPVSPGINRVTKRSCGTLQLSPQP